MHNTVKRKELLRRFRIWESLLDTSTYFALAGLKLKGYSGKNALRQLRRNWMRDCREHMQASSEVINKLYAKRNKNR